MTLQVELVSPERILYSGEAEMVIARTVGGGDIAFLPGHSPFVAILSDVAELAEQIDVERARQAMAAADRRAEADHDAEADAAVKRAHVRLAAAGGLPAAAH